MSTVEETVPQVTSATDVEGVVKSPESKYDTNENNTDDVEKIVEEPKEPTGNKEVE